MHKLQRSFGLVSIVALLMGSMIGSGIFLIPTFVADKVSSPVIILVAWAIAGALTLFSALYLAEFFVLMPETGGLYFYFKTIFGSFIAFLFGWSNFIILSTGLIAGIAYAFGSYCSIWIPDLSISSETIEKFSFKVPLLGRFEILTDITTKILAISAVTLLTLLNSINLNFAKNVQTVLTALKLIAIILLCFGIFHAQHSVNYFAQDAKFHYSDYLDQLIIAIGGALWAYTGWINIFSISGEIRNPSVNIPKSLYIGIGTVTLIYLLINSMYLSTLTQSQMTNSKFIAFDSMQFAFGELAGKFLSVLIILFSFGSLNGNIMATSRISFAMAQDIGIFLWAGDINRKFKTPTRALFIQAIWTSALILFVRIDQLITITILVSSIFAFLISLGSFIARRKITFQSNLYKAPLYPSAPLIGLGLSLAVFFSVSYDSYKEFYLGAGLFSGSALGILLVIIGIPFYHFSRRTVF